MTVKNAHNAGIPAGVCGEHAADPAYAIVFMDMGADFLSVSPRSIGKLCLFRQKNGLFEKNV